MKLFSFFSRPSIEEIAAYQHKMPRSVRVNISYDDKTKYWTAKVSKLDNKAPSGLIITESKTEEGLVNAVNDAVLTYLDFPDYMKSSVPKLLPEDISFARKASKSSSLVFAK